VTARPKISKPKTKSASRRSKPAARSRTSGDWRAETLQRARQLINETDSDIVEERKWFKPSNPQGIPVWSRAGIICTGETYKQVVKLTFACGASLKDPRRLFNSSLEGHTRRAIDIHEGEALDAKAFKSLIKAAVEKNLQAGAVRSKSLAKAKRVKLLSGDNPQVAKGEGKAPVRAYITAIPGWKREVAKHLDTLITRTLPDVRKAVKWNSAFYGVKDQGWFLSFHVFSRYVKVGFFRGASLKPVPPGESKDKNVRYLDIHEYDRLDEKQFASWVKQASVLPGFLVPRP